MMRRFGWIALGVVVTSLAIVSGLFANSEEKVALDQLPAAVGAVLAQKTVGCTIKEITKEIEDGTVVYEAEYQTADGRKCEIEIAEDGTILEEEVSVTLDQVPPAVQAAIEKAVGDGEILEITRETEDGKVVYEAEYRTADGKKREIELAEDGAILEEEDEDDSDDDEEDEETVSLDQVPAAVKAAIEKAVGGGEILEITREIEDGKVVYEAEYRTADGKKREIELAEDGTILEEEDDDD